jgi:hypothetical protein
MTLLAAAWGEKKLVTSSSKNVRPEASSFGVSAGTLCPVDIVRTYGISAAHALDKRRVEVYWLVIFLMCRLFPVTC